MEILLGLIIVGVPVFLIGYPLIKKEEPSYRKVRYSDEEDSLEKQKESVFTTLGEIEFDYQMKKLSEEDYQFLKNMYKRQAINILKAQEEEEMSLLDQELESDELEAQIEKEIELEIEREVQLLRYREGEGKKE
ncbi:hypothetical protein [Calderihabitans maritimus]|uniref:Uncharacterized protein n=1 Tax=Calderihabitans maritimus TaxID=1246530 RepID=A0A1Z5HWF0_9FIRM|nr:hypothetical protein [Calderihabitans maritimus]GAW93738.1 hypothetical protein Flexsi_0594 [Calderihabitans maritimus]